MNYSSLRTLAPAVLLLLGFTGLIFHTPTAAAHEGHEHAVDDKMAQAAQKFLNSLDDDLRKKASFEYNSDERENWHFIPKDRPGVSLKEMSLEQRQAAHDLLQVALSSQGYLKATAVMSLEQVLHELEKDSPTRKHDRDQERYWFSIFGTPGGEEPWGWRVEGHHLSLNFSSDNETVITFTPSFIGANPAEVRTGPRAGLRVLAAEEDLARDLMATLRDEQRKETVIAVEAPRDVITGPGQSIDIGKPTGLSAGEMNEAQQKLLWSLILEYTGTYRPEITQNELEKMKATSDATHFAWAGSLERGEGHYYRIHGPTFIIEYDNTQNDANHIHTVWHSLDNDFGLDTLRKHYEKTSHQE